MEQPAFARQGTALLYGMMCHGLFVVSVSMMMFQLYSGMSRTFGAVPPPWTWLVNALLLLQFPLLHSVFLTRRGRVFLKYLAPAQYAAELSTTTYVLVASVQVLLLFSLWSFSDTIWWRAEGVAKVVLSVLFAASWVLLGKSILDAGWTLQTGWLGWSAVYKNTRPSYPAMPTRGLFRLCRQPIYLAFACTLWTTPTWTPDQLPVALTLTCYCLIGPVFKEARFTRMFGRAFTDYKRRHRYWLPLPLRRADPQRSNDLRIYDQFAEQWWNGSVRWLRTLHNLVPARMGYFDGVVDWQGKLVLDLGCGGGFMSEALAKRGARVVGLDRARSAIGIATAHAASNELPIHYAVASGERLPLADRSMDHVVCVDVLEHVEDLGQVLDEIRRVLRPGGTFLFDTINDNALASLVIVVIGERVIRLLPRGTHDPARFISPGKLVRELRLRGFVDCNVTGLGPVGITRRLDITFGRLPFLTIQYMGYARLEADPPVML